MRRSARPAEKQANLENDAHKEPNAKKHKLNDKIAKIAALDNGTMVEAFKFLDYCQLAKKSIVSKRFCNVIQTHRQSLPRLYVNDITMDRANCIEKRIKIFNKELSAEAYDEWVIRNRYSKQVALECQVDEKESTDYNREIYLLSANDDDDLLVRAELNHENWPLFQHFVRLLSDPFVYIDIMRLVPQNDVLNLLAEAINPDRGRLQCEALYLDVYFHTQKFISWINDRVCCDVFYICGDCTFLDSNYDQELLNLFVTGAHCSSDIDVKEYDLSDVFIDFVKKFLDLKNFDEYQLVESITSEMYDLAEENKVAYVLKREYPKCIVREEHSEDDSNTHSYDFEFNNYDIEKKMQLNIYRYLRGYDEVHFSLNIKDL